MNSAAVAVDLFVVGLTVVVGAVVAEAVGVILIVVVVAVAVVWVVIAVWFAVFDLVAVFVDFEGLVEVCSAVFDVVGLEYSAVDAETAVDPL